MLVQLQKGNFHGTFHPCIRQGNRTSHRGVLLLPPMLSFSVPEDMAQGREEPKENIPYVAVLWLPQKKGDRQQLCSSSDWSSLINKYKKRRQKRSNIGLI